MKILKQASLVMATVFSLGFIASLLKKEVSQEILFFEINNIWIY